MFLGDWVKLGVGRLVGWLELKSEKQTSEDYMDGIETDIPKIPALEMLKKLYRQGYDLGGLDIETQKKVGRALLKYDFKAYLKRVFKELNPGSNLVWGWYLDAMCWELVKCLPVKTGLNPIGKQTQNLLINISPRSLKSETCSIAWRTWVQGHMPWERFIGASCSNDLAMGFNEKSIQILKSEWYREIFPDLVLTSSSKRKYWTSMGGESITTSPQGRVIGKGGNWILIDDLMTFDQAESEAERSRCNRFFNETLGNRTNDKSIAVFTVIMQRIHPEDLTEQILALEEELGEDSWRKVIIPAHNRSGDDLEFDIGPEFLGGKERKKIMRAGEYMDPVRLGEEVLKKEEIINPRRFGAIYLQDPTPVEGAIFKMANVGRWGADIGEVIENRDGGGYVGIYQSWDTGIKDGARNDFSVGTTWLINGGRYYLIDLVMGKWKFSKLVQMVEGAYMKWNPNAVLIEDKASGQQLIQVLRESGREVAIPVIGLNPGNIKKEDRAIGISHLIEGGMVYVPEGAERLGWWHEWEKQMKRFGDGGSHDDIVDSVTQFLSWAKNSGTGMTARLRSLG